MTRLRKISIRQGQLQLIADVLIRSLLHHRNSGQTVVNFMEVIFGVTQRHLVFATAARPFELDGDLIASGTRMLVRHDERDANLFEVSLLSDGDAFSRLTAAQWREISPCIALTDKKAHEGAEGFFGGVVV